VAAGNADTVRGWLDGVNEPGLARTLELSDEYIEIGNLPEFVIQGPYRGHAGVHTWFDESFDVVADRRMVVEDVIEIDGDTVVTVQLVTGTSTHTGLAFDLRWAAVWKVRGGKVERVQGYATKGRALKAATAGNA
jgi:ketosteroid isomerase-like protein